MISGPHEAGLNKGSSANPRKFEAPLCMLVECLSTKKRSLWMIIMVGKMEVYNITK